VKATEKLLKQKLKEGKIRGYTVLQKSKKTFSKTPGKHPNRVKKVDSVKRRGVEKQWMYDQLCWFILFNDGHEKIKEEHQFHKTRLWKFDFALISKKIAIEYEGLMSEKSRHTTVTGFTGDADKYNAAQADGWIVLRYTVLNYKNVIQEFKEVWLQRTQS